MRLAIQLLTWNRTDCLPELFDSLSKQSDQDWDLYTWDNGSSKTVIETLVEYLERFKQKHKVVSYFSKENIGFSGGHQALFEKHDYDLILLVNDDIIFDSFYIAKLRSFLEHHKEAGAVSGMILRWNWNENGKIEKKNILDTYGLTKTLSEKVYDCGGGKELWGVERKIHEVFGVSGCLPMYRRQAVIESSHDGRLFDPNYFCYKEDIDLAYRMRHLGWKAYIIPEAISYHQRTFVKNHRSQVPIDKVIASYRNHLWNLYVHVRWQEWISRGWIIVFFELLKFSFFLFTKPKVLFSSYRQTIACFPELKKKRIFFQRYHL